MGYYTVDNIEYLLRRGKPGNRYAWDIRQAGKFVSKETESKVFKHIFGKRTRLVEYVRTFVFEGDKGQEYYGVDVIEEVEEPADITEEEIEKNLKDPGRAERMLNLLASDQDLPGNIRFRSPVEKQGTGGARFLTRVNIKKIRWEDLRSVEGGK